MRRSIVDQRFRRVLGSMIVLALVASVPSTAQPAALAGPAKPSLELLQVDQKIFLGVVPRTSSFADIFEDFEIGEVLPVDGLIPDRPVPAIH